MEVLIALESDSCNSQPYYAKLKLSRHGENRIRLEFGNPDRALEVKTDELLRAVEFLARDTEQ